ncbi:MAG: ATP-binding cassette domain-containing protein [Oscillospiraceae bacterium]|jgi:ABC-2 type transport system ATP-binding protein|nr:ATP-binding cassette domain-containing protein [Oscillospiraceae bacterium]
MPLEVTNLIKRYGDKLAVNGLTFSLTKPGVMALLGTNGAGKTTSIRIILGMLSKDGGSVLWNGTPLKATESPVGYLAEERGLYPKYKVIDQIKYFAKLKGLRGDKAKARIDYWFDRLEIAEYLTKTASQLSKGNQQKVQLAAALISEPELLILDEPLSGLDPVNSDLFKSVIREEIDKGKFIIMSSHQMATVEEFCEDIIIMHRGETVLQGNLNIIKKSRGRVNLSIKSDGDIKPIAAECGLQLVSETPNGIDFKIQREKQAAEFLHQLVDRGITPVRFDLREPSLHEIFVEKAGHADESL